MNLSQIGIATELKTAAVTAKILHEIIVPDHPILSAMIPKPLLAATDPNEPAALRIAATLPARLYFAKYVGIITFMH